MSQNKVRVPSFGLIRTSHGNKWETTAVTSVRWFSNCDTVEDPSVTPALKKLETIKMIWVNNWGFVLAFKVSESQRWSSLLPSFLLTASLYVCLVPFSLSCLSKCGSDLSWGLTAWNSCSALSCGRNISTSKLSSVISCYLGIWHYLCLRHEETHCKSPWS